MRPWVTPRSVLFVHSLSLPLNANLTVSDPRPFIARDLPHTFHEETPKEIGADKQTRKRRLSPLREVD